MNTTLSWIKEYIPDLDVTAQEYADAMTLSGTKVENYRALDADLDKIVVGQIKEMVRHPDADHLWICQVDIGTEIIQIVTGAPNVREGMLTPVVLPGGRVAGSHDGKMKEGGIEIHEGKLRGVSSNGMMCSIEELGSSRDFYPEAPEDGLYPFAEGTVKPGDDAIAALGLHDTNVEYEITSNRVDCYSVIGIAREAAATFQKEFHLPKVRATGNKEDVRDYISVEVREPELCKRYVARVVKNIHLAPSPAWLQHRLASNGIRPINNLVDITNYVMEEYGQPMHAYDLDTIAGRKIIVDRAKDGETFTTLDAAEMTLDSDILMINDAEKPIGIAGIMGGQNSMISPDVHTMLLEAACFDGTNIRLSAKRLGHQTDASGKFDKGLDPTSAMEAMNRACELVEELGAGEVVGGVIDFYPVKREEEQLPFEPEKINALLGTNFSKEEQLDFLKRVELLPDPKTGNILIPTFRQDIHRTCDLAEEVARFSGYDNIPTTLPRGEATCGRISFKNRIEEVARDVAEYCGFSEGYCYSFESPKVFDKLLLPEEDSKRQAIRISNPLGEDFSLMRTSSINGILNALSFNYNRRNKAVKLYEIGNIYLPKELPLKELPEEKTLFTLGMYQGGDFYDMKGVLEEFLSQIGMKERIFYKNSEKKSFLHPGRQAGLLYQDRNIGFLGEVHPLVQKNYQIGERVLLAVLDLQAILPFASFERKFEGIAKYPAVNRDLSLVVPREVTAEAVETIFRQRGGNILEDIRLFDLYAGGQIEEGYKSMAYSLSFRSKEKTLTEEDIQKVMKKIMNGLESLDIRLRS